MTGSRVPGDAALWRFEAVWYLGATGSAGRCRKVVALGTAIPVNGQHRTPGAAAG